MNNEPSGKINLSVAEAAQSLGICVRSLQDIIKRGEIDVCRIGTRCLLPRAAVEAFAEARVGTWTPARVGRNVRAAGGA